MKNEIKIIILSNLKMNRKKRIIVINEQEEQVQTPPPIQVFNKMADDEGGKCPPYNVYEPRNGDNIE